MLDALTYYVWIQLAAFAVLPLTWRVLRVLPDRGYPFSKFLGLLSLTYLAWVLGMFGFLQHVRASLVLLLVGLALVCWKLWGREAQRSFGASPRMVLGYEAFFLLALAGAVFIRAFNADIIGQEKFMDFAFMNALYTADRLPVEDPWLAGYAMPYYHFGYLLMATASKLAAVAAPVGYNMAVALVLALTLLLSASLAANAARLLRSSPLVWGVLAASFVGIVGNLGGLLEVLAAQGFGSPELWQAIGIRGLEAAAHSQGWPPPAFNWFRASRVISSIQPDGITEFPYFSFLLGDLHPHYMALPHNLLIVGLAFALVLGGYRAFGRPGLAVSGLALGSLIATNTWDVPTFWLLFAAASAYAFFRVPSPVSLVAPFLLAVILFVPYYVGYTSQPLGVGLVQERTPVVSLLVVLGPFLLATLALGVWGATSGLAAAGLAHVGRLLGPFAPRLLGLATAIILAALALSEEWTLLLFAASLALLLPLAPALLLAPSPRPPVPSSWPPGSSACSACSSSSAPSWSSSATPSVPA